MAIDFNYINRYKRTIEWLIDGLENPEHFTSKEARNIIGRTYHTVTFDTLKRHNIVIVVEKEEFEVTPKCPLLERYCVFDNQGKFVTSFFWPYEAKGAVQLLKKANNANYEVHYQVPPVKNNKVNAVRYYYKLDTDRFTQLVKTQCEEIEKEIAKKEKYLEYKREEIQYFMKKAQF